MLQPNPLSTFYDLFKSDQSSSLHVKIKILNNKIEGALTQYKSSKDVRKGYELLIHLESKVNTLFEHYRDYQFEESDVDQLTNLCRRINEDPVFQEIREFFAELLLTEQKGEIEKEVQPSLLNQEKMKEPFDQDGSSASGSTMPSLESVDKASPTLTMEIKQNRSIPAEIQQSDIKQLFLNMKEEYEQHKIDPAYEFLRKIKNLSATTQSGEIQALMEENNALMDEIEMLYEFSMKILLEMEDEHGYLLERVKNNFDVKYKAVKGERLGLKVEGILNVSLFNFLALINEPEGYTKWMPFCSQARVEKQINRATRIFYTKCWLPPPICGREMYGYGAGFDRLQKNGSILLISKSINEDGEAQQRFGLDVPSKSRTKRMEMEYMGVELYPLSAEQTKIKVVLKFDPKIKYLPLSFINWHVRKLGHVFFDRIVSKASNFKGSLWERKIQENRELYGFLEEKFNQFLQSKNLQA